MTYRGVVEPGWIDVNRHMNVTSYDRVFDAAEVCFFATIGIDDATVARTGHTLFRLEKLVRYEHELVLAAPLEVHSRLVWTDFKRLHHQHELVSVADGRRAAFMDAMSVHVLLSTRRSSPIASAEVRGALATLRDAHAPLGPAAGIPARGAGHRFGA